MKNHWLHQDIDLEIHTHNMTVEEVDVFLNTPVMLFANRSALLFTPDEPVCGPIFPKNIIGGYRVKCRKKMDTLYLSGLGYNFEALINNGWAIFVPYAERSHQLK